MTNYYKLYQVSKKFFEFFIVIILCTYTNWQTLFFKAEALFTVHMVALASLMTGQEVITMGLISAIQDILNSASERIIMALNN